MKYTVFEAANLFQSLKLHFGNKKHNYFEKPFVLTQKQLNKRKDRYQFIKLSRQPDLFNYLVANLSTKPSIWSGELFSDESKNRYANWRKINNALSYWFEQEIQTLDLENFNNNFICNESNHPTVLVKYLEHKISLETLVILLELCKCESYFNKKLNEDIIWNDVKLLVQKYKPFVEYDKEKFRKIVLNLTK